MTKLLVLAETDGASVLPDTLPTLAFAQSWAAATGGSYDLLLTGGPEIAQAATDWQSYGAGHVLVAASPDLTHPVADRLAAVVNAALQQTGATSLAAPSSTFGRDVLPRIAALRDLPMLSDVLSVTNSGNGLTFRRPMYAGNLIATVTLVGNEGVFSVRGTAFGKPEPSATASPIEAFTGEMTPTQGTTWIGLDAPERKRPDLTAARVVVSGGRPLRDAETFERLLGGLADKLGGAVGATRAAVDSGIAPNELQVGQTGKVVAPELYIAAGISGSIQHLAGMKDSKVIVAINTDPDAPIFQVADYGLVADLHQAVPELTRKL
ncbi:MAG TPA: FAD-binding protein [Chthonomonadaceae bacterium]|nr:FAD-binding protein [Chthonomonadaceae bacterium]